MTSVDRFLEQIQESETRYQQLTSQGVAAEGTRGPAAQEIERNAALRARMERLKAPKSLIEDVGTRAPIGPLITEGMSERGIIEAITLERVLGKNDLMPVAYLLLGLQRSLSVGRIDVRNQNRNHSGYGTGFLVSPRLLMTNNHVLQSASDARFSIVEFDHEQDFTGDVRPSVRRV